MDGTREVVSSEVEGEIRGNVGLEKGDGGVLLITEATRQYVGLVATDPVQEMPHLLCQQ